MSRSTPEPASGRSLRSLTILRTISRYRLDTLIAPYAPDRLRWLFRISPLNLIPVGERSRGERLKLALSELGPVFIKFGQLLSTRRDLIPLDIADELAELQDAVPPFPGDQARALVAEALAADFDSVFSHFEDDPMASASVAQVHPATLTSGEAVGW